MENSILLLLSLLIVLSNIYILGTSRIGIMIRAIAFQGAVISILPFFIHTEICCITEILLLSVLNIFIKGFVIPHYLKKVSDNVKVKRELNPYIGYTVSVISGLVITFASFYLVKKLPLYHLSISPFHTAAAFASVLIGMFLISGRRNIIAQIIGYLVFENAGFILGISIASAQPLFIEIGVLLDLLAGVVIMVVAVNRIHIHFDSVNADSLERLSK